MLYPAEAHDRLTDAQWDEGRAREAIRAIVADACATYDPDAFWPAHEWDGWQATLPMKNLYCGAAGVAWALDALRRRGHAEPALDPADVARRALEPVPARARLHDGARRSCRSGTRRSSSARPGSSSPSGGSRRATSSRTTC